MGMMISKTRPRGWRFPSRGRDGKITHTKGAFGQSSIQRLEALQRIDPEIQKSEQAWSAARPEITLPTQDEIVKELAKLDQGSPDQPESKLTDITNGESEQDNG